MNKRLYIVLDTETTNNMDFPFVYDLGFSVVDKTGKVYYKRSFVIYDIYVLCKDLMRTAYYANKLPQYEIDLKSKKRELVRFSTARKIILQTIREYNIYAIMAHNMRFDYGSTNNTPSPPTPKFLWHKNLHASGLSSSGMTLPLLSSIIGKSFPIPCIFENFNPFKSTMVSTYFKCGGMLCLAYKSS